jgi:tRNA-splicing endonuclease subunit Sen2
MMADTIQNSTDDHGGGAQSPAQVKRPHLTRMQQLNKLYALPAPLRTFPLPTFVPHNPLSLFHVLYVWLSQTIQQPSSHFETPYYGWFSPDTRSVHVTDSRSIRGLWEQGFYGKGSLSRSEPNWLNREKNRRGSTSKATSEERTRKVRLERQQMKWERARKEREAIDQKLTEEAEAELAKDSLGIETTTSAHSEPLVEDQASSRIMKDYGDLLTKGPRVLLPPIGPMELLSLPNSFSDLEIYFAGEHRQLHEPWRTKDLSDQPNGKPGRLSYEAPVGPLELLALPNSDADPFMDANSSDSFSFAEEKILGHGSNGHAVLEDQTHAISKAASTANGDSSVNGLGINGHSKTTQLHNVEIGEIDIKDEDIRGSADSDDTTDTSSVTRSGSALVNGCPGTPKIKRQKSVRFSPTVEKNTFIQSEPPSPERGATSTTTVEEEPPIIRDQEHFQLTMEEAFFLSYALGVLTILDPATKAAICKQELFSLFRKSSFYPPLSNPGLFPDDPFMINYVVYHHFRSLGWVVRGGVKFSMDYMLYNRGPVFSHAEFGVIILPSYSDPYWNRDVFLQNYVKGKEKRSWSWLHCINRVITQVKKTLIIVYVDIPKPLNAGEEEKLGVDGVLGRYRVREFMMKRWSANRMRD